ncbi:reverse transcriptase domain-containing protein [Tanacetum coccineum]|uniref:Reverse transcriptase domain-containing protein n=1 Tax=Tanacetum coccineum TaxID=301880 RepID=A0ABQ5EYI6_9ASTR
MINCNPSRTPIDTDSKLGPDGVPVQDLTLYRSLTGGLQYLTFTRPDLSYAVQQGTLELGLLLYARFYSLGGLTLMPVWAGCPFHPQWEEMGMAIGEDGCGWDVGGIGKVGVGQRTVGLLLWWGLAVAATLVLAGSRGGYCCCCGLYTAMPFGALLLPCYEEIREDLFAANHPSSNPTSPFSSHTNLTSTEVNDDIFDPEEDITENLLNLDKTKDLPQSPRSSDFLPECDSVFYEDFSEVDALSSTNNEDNVFNPGILIHENLFEVTNFATPGKNVKKTTNVSLILEYFNPPLYELPFHKEVPRLGALLSFSSKNEEKAFNTRILTSKRVHTSLLPEISYQGTKAFKVTKILESPMEIFPCSYKEDIRVLDVPCLHFYPP